MKRIVVTRALTSADLALAARFGLDAGNGLRVEPQEIVAIERAPELLAEWRDGTRGHALAADAWAFTSRHAVDAFACIRRTEDNLHVPRCYAVGPATGAALGALGIRPHLAGGTGRQLALSIARDAGNRRVFYWRGDVTMGSFATTLRDANVSLDEWIVYRKRERRVSVAAKGLAALAVLSPSQVRAAARALDGALLSSTAIVAIGPTTAAEVRAVFGRPAVIAPIPTLPALLAAVSRTLDVAGAAPTFHGNAPHGHAEPSLAHA